MSSLDKSHSPGPRIENSDSELILPDRSLLLPEHVKALSSLDDTRAMFQGGSINAALVPGRYCLSEGPDLEVQEIFQTLQPNFSTDTIHVKSFKDKILRYLRDHQPMPLPFPFLRDWVNEMDNIAQIVARVANANFIGARLTVNPYRGKIWHTDSGKAVGTCAYYGPGSQFVDEQYVTTTGNSERPFLLSAGAPVFTAQQSEILIAIGEPGDLNKKSSPKYGLVHRRPWPDDPVHGYKHRILFVVWAHYPADF